MIMQWSLLVACALFGIYEAAYVDTLRACSLGDDDCSKNFVQNVIKDLSSQGIPEYNIPPIDPFVIKDVDIPILNLMNVTIEDAVVKGINDCVVNYFKIEAGKGKATLDLVCDINIKGRSKILGTSEDLQNAFGSDSIHGGGNFEITLSKLHSTLNLRYHLILKDGEVYIKAHQDEFTYKNELGGAHFSAENIYVGDKDQSQLVVDYLNNNYKLLVDTFGSNLHNIAINGLTDKLVLYTDNIPAKYFVKDDLITYVRNDYAV